MWMLVHLGFTIFSGMILLTGSQKGLSFTDGRNNSQYDYRCDWHIARTVDRQPIAAENPGLGCDGAGTGHLVYRLEQRRANRQPNYSSPESRDRCDSGRTA